MTSNQRILHPFTLPNGTELKNRLLMAPMTTCTGYFDGTVTSELVEYYRARAGSIGAIIVECCFIDDYGLAFPGAIGIDNDEKVAGLAKIAAAIKAEGSKAILQIYHGGRMVDPQLIGGRQPVAPSAIAAPRDGAATPRALSGEEVEGMIAKFGEGVRRAIQAGFDGVEIHGANTYLIQQFYSPNSNQRDDEWGGSRDNRARFPLAVLDITHKMARQYADDAFIIGYRFSPEEMEVPGIRFADTMYLLEKLAARGVDYLHFSVGATLRPSIVDTSDPTPLIEKYCAMRSETLAQVPVMGVGGVVNAADAGQGLDHGYDLMAVGRACIAYPDWTARIAAGEELELFIDSTQREALNIPEPLWRFSLVEAMIRDMSMGDAKFKPGMFVKAMLKSSKALAAEEGAGDAAPKSYDVVVVGSGGAGLAAAIQAYDEGASVLIVEKMPTIGGNTIKASAGMNAAETRFQRVKGIEDSKELFYQETLKGGKNKNDPQLLRRFVENAPEAIEWLARRGIMLNDITTTGGFSANSAMVVKYRPDLAGFVTTNHKGATGGGIALLERIGAGTVDMGEIQIHPTVEQQTSYLISESIRGGGAILVNPQGNRFFNEMETRDKVSAAIIALPEHFAYIVFDEHVRAKNKAADEYIAKGFVTSASSPRQLAEKLGMDYHAFLNTLERYNGFVEKQHDDDFGRTTALRAPINEGPYHAIRIAPGVHHTMGGVTVNTDTAVLNAGHQVIAGAFAAGEVVGGIHGGNRIGGNAVADIIIFGTLAGHQAAKRARS